MNNRLFNVGNNFNKKMSIDHDRKTPLHNAAIKSSATELEQLVNNGADLSVLDMYGTTVQHYAAKGGNVDALKWFFKKGLDMQAKTHDDSSLLHFAAQQNKPEVIEYLIHVHKLDPNHQNADGATPMHFAAQSLHKLVLERLKTFGGNMLVTDNNENTPIRVYLNALLNTKNTAVPTKSGDLRHFSFS